MIDHATRDAVVAELQDAAAALPPHSVARELVIERAAAIARGERPLTPTDPLTPGPSVQPPTREQIAVIDRLRHRLRNAPDWANDVCVQRADLDAVLALFPQPTPVDPDDEFVAPYEMRERGVREQPTLSAEPMVPLRAVVAVMDHYDNGEGECEPEDRWRLFRDMRSLFASDQVIRPAAEPVSIADMAPGTMFTADTWPGAFPVRWRKEPDGWFSRIANGGRSYFPEPGFDQSTIRDVTPPPATPKATS